MVSYFKWEIVSGKVHNKIELIKFVSAAHRLVGIVVSIKIMFGILACLKLTLSSR
jgi:hypothetical protein